MEERGEEQKNKNRLGQFPYLQGSSVPQAGYTMLFVRVDAHVHYCIAYALGETGPLVLGFAHVAPPLDPDGGYRHTGRP